MGAKLGGAGGGSKYDLGQNSDINVTPFVDIMLVLLIIFMVAAPLATVNVAVDLPPPNLDPPPPSPKEPIFISLQNNGEIYLGDNPVPLGSLIGTVVQRTKGDRDNRIMVRADRNVLYGNVMNVMNMLQEYGYTKVALIAEEV